MGAKSAVKLRNRGKAHKCDLCGRKLMSSDALKSHLRATHNIVSKKPKLKVVTKPVTKLVKIVPKPESISKPLTPQKNNAKSVKFKEETTSEVEPMEVTIKDDLKKPSAEFECPKCFRIFVSYFPALKHIQKFHCVNKQGNRVAPNSPYLIQPVRVEMCLKCDRKVKSLSTHICDITLTIKPNIDNVVCSFICSACNERFESLKNFDMHVLSLHGDEIESMFFPTSAEFTSWKQDMEQMTQTTYSVLDKYISRRYYHCNHVKADLDNEYATHFCPSIIVIQEFSKGIQVHYYKHHYKHNHKEYKLPVKYKKFSITSFLKGPEGYYNLMDVSSDSSDLYLQFKTLMEGIVVDAAKVNIPTLKILIGKALELTSIITSYDEEVDDNITSNVDRKSNMSDTDITKVLEDNNGKRKSSTLVEINELKRAKSDIPIDSNDISSPKIINSFSLANQNGNDIGEVLIKDGKSQDSLAVEEKTGVKNTKLPEALKIPSDQNQAPSSFNDSYRDFVVKNFPEIDAKRRTRSASQPFLKTKMGQFKPKDEDIKPTPHIAPKVMEQIKPSKGTDLKTKPSQKAMELSKVTAKVTEQSKVSSKATEQSKVSSKATEQLKPSKVTEHSKVTPKVIEKSKSNLRGTEEKIKKVTSKPISLARVSIDKPKVDFEYEVKEQDEGCNILILKI